MPAKRLPTARPSVAYAAAARPSTRSPTASPQPTHRAQSRRSPPAVPAPVAPRSPWAPPTHLHFAPATSARRQCRHRRQPRPTRRPRAASAAPGGPFAPMSPTSTPPAIESPASTASYAPPASIARTTPADARLCATAGIGAASITPAPVSCSNPRVAARNRSPAPTGYNTASGARPPSCSTISNASVFCPSLLYGFALDPASNTRPSSKDRLNRRRHRVVRTVVHVHVASPGRHVVDLRLAGVRRTEHKSPQPCPRGVVGNG